MKTVHLVMLKPFGPIDGMRRLLKWKAARSIPDGKGGRSLKIYEEGMHCEIDDANLKEARSFCWVTIQSSKEVEEDGG